MENCFLYTAFQECLTAEYSHGENAVSFSADIRGNRLTIFFEPSNGQEDWDNNLDFATVPYLDGTRCHGGFLRVFESARPILKPFLLDPAVEEAFIVGYSHGAALALLCHLELCVRRPALCGNCITLAYGMPRVLAGKLSPALAPSLATFYRIVNEGDIVTHLPPRLFGFRHVGNRISIGKRGRYSPVDAHRPENYLASLEEKKKNCTRGAVFPFIP